MIRWLAVLLIALSVAPAAHACGLSLYTVQGTSMAPLIRPGDRLETLPLDCLPHNVGRGDVVVFASGADPRPLVKRVVAQPSDKFSAVGGVLSVNGHPVLTSLGRPYNLDPARLTMIALYERDYGGIVPADTFLVMGEQPGGTADSSLFGLVNRADVQGVVVNNLDRGFAHEPDARTQAFRDSGGSGMSR
jgi:signal peptidase I